MVNDVPSNATELCFSTATDIARWIRTGDISARDVMAAHLEQIERINPTVNAIVTLLDGDDLMESALSADETLAKSGPDNLGPLYGLPVGIKDLQPTAGIRTTYGSPIFKDLVPTEDSLTVQRYKDAGAIVIGKTNTPEFGAGSQTFNEVFGTTLNPYDLTKTCGGSSGGATVALACGMMPIAQGSDFGGSLRNPAAWSNVVGMRNSIGTVPVHPAPLGYTSESVTGGMGRTVTDVALQLVALAGPDPRVPSSLMQPSSVFSQPLERDFAGTRIAWSRNVGGAPIDSAINETLDAQRDVLEDLGCIVEDAEPPLQDAGEIFHVLRAAIFAHQHEANIRDHRDLVKETIIWNAEEGMRLTALDVKKAEERRSALYARMAEFMSDYDYLMLPVTSVPPFSADLEYPTSVAGQPLANYLEWMSPCSNITVTGLPAISVPAGFDKDGLPTGLQIVGRQRADFSVLQMAHAFEQATEYWRKRPALAT
ncbi:MAG: amidase [Chloroflexi bacterium]|nr:amidase [Chloroflexota bacterium]MYK60452.1 amidase [Chloroflexota bacterium]